MKTSYLVAAAVLTLSACSIGEEVVNDDVLTETCDNPRMTTPGDFPLRCGPQSAVPHTEVDPITLEPIAR